MKEEMKALCTEGVAIHGGLGPCGAVRKGDVEAWALGYVQAGLLSHETNAIGVPTPFSRVEGNIRVGAMRAVEGLRGVEEPRMHGTFMRENREIPFSPAVHGRGGGPLREG